MKYTVVNMSTNERISCTTRDEGRELAVRLKYIHKQRRETPT